MLRLDYFLFLPNPFRAASLKAVFASALACLAFGPFATRGHAQALPTDAKASCVVSSAAFATWFASGTPTLNGVVNPANSITFPNSPNCSFYQWSQQMFLWLTSPAPATYGGGGGRIFNSPTFYDVSPPDASGARTFIPHTPGILRPFPLRVAKTGPHMLPVVLDKSGHMLEVQRAKPGVLPMVRNSQNQLEQIQHLKLDENKKPILLNKTGAPVTFMRSQATLAPKELSLQKIQQSAVPLAKSTLVTKFIIDGHPIFIDGLGNVDEVEQEQSDGGVLMAQNGSLIYYITVVNDVFAYFATGVKDHAINATAFPTTQAQANAVSTFASAHGKTIPDLNALAIEVKSSWIDVTGLPNAGDYITVQAKIPTYNTTSTTNWVPSGSKTATLALVGMHVVGSAAGHPELIWSTFEHFGNAPNVAYSYISTANTTRTVAQNTSGTWVFAHGGATGPFNQARMSLNGVNIEANTGFTIGPSDVLRMAPFGAASNASPNPLDSSAAASNSEILSIDNSVISKLNPADVRAKYYMLGSTWTIGGAPATSGDFGNPGNTGGNAVGTSQLADATMETFDQPSVATFDKFHSNCLLCHTLNTTDTSHVFGALKPLF